MANIAGSHDPELPFPFPQLEAETAPNQWQPLREVSVGAPAGRTKTILVPLGGHLPAGTRRLRLTYAFELHWDRIALFQNNQPAEVSTQRPTSTDLHWHGYGEFAATGPSDPLTPCMRVSVSALRGESPPAVGPPDMARSMGSLQPRTTGW